MLTESLDIFNEMKSGSYGAWCNEPDFASFEFLGMKREAKRTPNIGVWCGYVYVSDSSDTEYIDAHGGITFDAMMEDGRRKIGFDRGHYGDYLPSEAAIGTPEGIYGFYRDFNYVLDQIKEMVKQLVDSENT